MTPDEKLCALREKMQERELDAYLVVTDDYHMSEYVGEYFKQREYLTGFDGSAGTLVVMAQEAYLWTDGRYYLQAERQLGHTSIHLMKSGQPGVDSIEDFLAKELPVQGKIGLDGRTVTAAYVDRLLHKTAKKQIAVCAQEDLVGEIWKDRPQISKEPVWELPEEYAGMTRKEKLSWLHGQMEHAGADALLLSSLDEIAWLLNLRGNDVRHTPVFLAYMLLTKERDLLCVHREILSDDQRISLSKDGVETAGYDEMETLLRALPNGITIQADRKNVSYRLFGAIPAGVSVLERQSPIVLQKAVKNRTEISHIRQAHIKDGVAVTRFLCWLKTHVGQEKITEREAAEKLEEFRAREQGYIEPSFAPIIAYAEHGAIVHYEASEETDAVLEPKGLLLADTGGHYLDGTTDVTRTIALGAVTEEEKKVYTAALRGNLHLGAAKFRYGCCGQNLDILAREPLWELGMDFQHGTGHGVGYLLSVHEGPQAFRYRIAEHTEAVRLEEGMVISNEPGCYLAGKFGVRHENLVLCKKAEQTEMGQFMCFETLTLVPFDVDAIDPAQMTPQELAWLNAYHKRVYQAISPYLEGEELAWLFRATNILTCH